MNLSTQNAGLTQVLTRRVLSLRREDLPPEVDTLARQCLLDVLGVTIAGHDDAISELMLADMQAQGGPAQATVLGGGQQLGIRQAALVNGCAAHALDFDDVNLSINGHPSAVILPPLLALGEYLDASGEALMMAFISGYEFACRAGVLVEPGHYARGYHATSSVGVLGVALACSRLLGLDEMQSRHAVGIAATQAAGLKGMFGTPCKPLHVGLAARNGLEAALWASQGLTSRTDVLECTQGFARTLSPDFHEDQALADPERFYMRENLFKYHAACYGTHSAIECALQLLSEHKLLAHDIESVLIRVERVADSTCNIADPKTSAQAKFSLRYATSLAFLGLDTASIDNFGQTQLALPELQRLRANTTVELVDGWGVMETEVHAITRDGRLLKAWADTGIASTHIARQGDRLAAKFSSLTTDHLGVQGSLALADAVQRIETVSVRQLVAKCITRKGAR